VKQDAALLMKLKARCALEVAPAFSAKNGQTSAAKATPPGAGSRGTSFSLFDFDELEALELTRKEHV